ncbi:MAG: hypothetical protein ACK4Z4_08745, partial [Ferrovibrio sp.]
CPADTRPGRHPGPGVGRGLRRPRPQIPVLLTSGAISVQDIPADLRDTELLLKPYDVDEVVRRIGPALAGAAASP